MTDLDSVIARLGLAFTLCQCPIMRGRCKHDKLLETARRWRMRSLSVRSEQLIVNKQEEIAAMAAIWRSRGNQTQPQG